MITVAVAGGQLSPVFAQLRHFAQTRGGPMAEVRVVGPEGLAGPADILVATTHEAPGARANVLVAGSDRAARVARDCGAHLVVTVGLSPRDTLTPSAMLTEGAMAALQRELVALDGTVVPPREIALDGLAGDEQDQMAAAAVLLLVSPNEGW